MANLLTPNPKFQAFDINGNPLSGGKLYSYESGTSTPLTTYSTASNSFPNANPVILNNRGEADVWLDSSKSYTLTLKDASDNTIWTADNVTTVAYLTTVSSVITSLYNVTIADNNKLILLNANSAAFTVTFDPAADLGNGFKVFFKKIDGSANAITLNPNSSETIDGATSMDITVQNEAVYLVCDGTGYQVLGDYNRLTIGDTVTASGAGSNVSLTLTNKGNEAVILGTAGTTTKVQLYGSTLQLANDQPIVDSSGNELLTFTKTSSAVNQINIANKDTTHGAIISADGDDSNISLNFQAKGTGAYRALGSSTASAELRLFEQTTNGTDYVGLKAPASIAAPVTFTLPGADGTSGQALTTDGAGNLVFSAAGAAVVKQRVTALLKTRVGGVTIMPIDNTIPQNTEGDEIMTCSITPTSATSKLLIQVHLNGNLASSRESAFALFQDSTAGALCAVASNIGDTQTAGHVWNSSLVHEMTAGTTSSTTFKVRLGPAASGTIWVNGNSTAAYFGGVGTSSITIWELA